jgi:prepilin peptidase CpaA
MNAFFPNLGFSWAFVGVLVALLLVAAYIDFRTLKIPKAVVFSILGTGVLANLVRGIWMGAQGRGVFLVSESTWWLGLLDGLVFALVGFVCAFAFLFVLWILRTCGGGDVKLIAALGAWLGPQLVLYAILVSVAVLFVVAIGQVVLALLTGKGLEALKDRSRHKPKWRMTYSFPVAVATAIVLLWFCRVDLGLANPPLPGKGTEVANHAR